VTHGRSKSSRRGAAHHVPADGCRVALVFLSAAAWGQGRTDQVNGDRFTGEIMERDRGRLELKTDDAGTIEIEWDNIGGIAPVRSRTSDGRRVLGSLGQTSMRGSRTRSRTVAQITVNSVTVFRPPAFLFQLSSSATVTEQSDGRRRGSSGQ
jgi:hypothetical protein